MRFLSLCRVELVRLLKNRFTWVIFLVIVVSPVVGLFAYQKNVGSLSSTYLANPAYAGALIGAVAMALLTLLSLSRPYRSNASLLTEVVISPTRDSLSKTITLFLAAIGIQLVTTLIWLPFTVIKLGSVFRVFLYFAFYSEVMLAAMLFAVLFCSAVYNLFRRFDVSAAAFVGFWLLSILVWQENWLLCWTTAVMDFLSDDFGNSRRLMSIGWNRLFWLLVLSGFWVLSLLFIRKYGKGFFGSLLKNIEKVYIPVISAALVALGVTAYIGQPFLDSSALEFDDYGVDYGGGGSGVECGSASVDIDPDLTFGSLEATAEYSLRKSTDAPTTVSFKINPGYRLRSVRANDQELSYRLLDDCDMGSRTLEVDLPEGEGMKLILKYGGFPTEWNLCETFQGQQEISREYVYLTNETLIPVFCDGYLGSARTKIDITLGSDELPVMFGIDNTVKQLETLQNGDVRWHIDCSDASPILYAGDYTSELIDAENLHIEFFYSKKHERVMKECNINQSLKQVIEYCTKHYGALNFYSSGKLRLMEIGTVGGGYAGDGASVMCEDSFSEEGLKDVSKGASGAEVIAHEIIHQWWGLGNMFDFEPTNDAWSAEGLTVYTTYRMMKELYGEEYARENYVELWQKNYDDYRYNFYVQNPEYLEMLPEQFSANIKNSLVRVNHYSVMPLMILKAEQLCGGEEAFDEILSRMFMTTQASYQLLTYENFLNSCNLSEEDLELE